ncbi:FAD-binding oxidoreductase [Loktanella sp. TSTF-M6]|uniref:FAD-binding oxidoreductase n=1 Tax=Loktanella gaetbuli TaxID=2881335 RepID=A0ABS8BVI0_9RHOB|nr:FAD-binding oxidoreductase [Loktanella gaetbuli]MCB5199712.1 FAD-binding oxidoreductase [Loktanella gaetbuli]
MNPLYRNDRPGVFPDSWYAASADIPPQRAELRGEVRADVVVVGAGYTGLTAALRLAQAGRRVVVLEAHRAGFGASGRNGGQVSSGYNWGQKDLAAKLGDGPARALWDASEQAKSDLREAVAAHAPDARYTPGVAYGVYSDGARAKVHAEADYLDKTYGYRTEPLDRDAFQSIVRAKPYAGGALDMGAGHVHPLRYVLGLARAVEAAGVVIHEGSEVHHIAHGTPAKVQTGRGHVIADHVVLAGNGYLPGIAPAVASKVMPINSFIGATAPLGDLADQILTRDIAVADEKFVVNYFRLSEDRRLLFGGRESYSIGFPRDIQTALRARMLSLFPQLGDVPLDYVWGGTLGITMTRLPALQRVAPNVLSGAGFSGHGVALSGFAGRVMAEAIIGQTDRFDVMAQLPVPSFPGGAALRAPLLALAMTWYSLRDRLGI